MKQQKQENANNPSLVVLAAGMGSRYGSLKQIDKFGPSGETIVDYTIYDALLAGFEKIVFVIRKDMEDDFREVFGFLYDRANVKYVFQEPDTLPEGFSIPEGRIKPWGTGHAVWMAKPYVDEPFAVINADDFYGRQSIHSIYAHLLKMDRTRLNACLLGYVLKNTLSDHGRVSRGICEVEGGGWLQGIIERTDIYRNGSSSAYFEENGQQYPLTGSEIVSMNLMGFSPQVFELIGQDFPVFLKKNHDNLTSEYYIPSVLENIRLQGISIPVILSNDVWFGVTYRQDKSMAVKKINALVEKGLYPRKLWS
ncbi:nucleotidyltransferase [Fulvivirga sp. M361]|uniref:nucleotidyltransferase family protein n=1 Tax=Fulvivirga sp. M361 TaxID=2594266 RepID=UPI00117A8420|nr:nucleotidyltransferase [Fulvivirga sp. M361]TRX49675.1 nucleotidyltransferase [Fulvivirga sp. M361]